MFRTLRSKLVASYAVIILLCLVLAGSAFVYMLRDYQREIKLNQLSDLVLPISWQVRLLERAGASSDQMASFLKDRAAEQQVRILLVDPSGTVVDDTSNSMKGEHVQLVGTTSKPALPRPGPSGGHTSVAIIHSDGQNTVFITSSADGDSPASERFVARAPYYSVVLAVPEQSLTANWLELAPSLSLAALVSLIVSIAAAALLSRSISRPLLEITRASEEMAQGRYEQHIQVRSRDEVGRLADTFNRMAREVSTSHRTLRDFLANVSHELRTPLTSIQGFSQAMVDGTVKSADEFGGAAEIINEETARMRRLVEDLLLLSKIESGQMPMDSARTDLRELLKASVRRMLPQAQQSGVELTLEADRSAPVIGDEGRLEQLFRNLIENALRHTPSGGRIQVRIEVAESAAGNGRSVRVAVHNTGSYIPPQDQERVFERFYQVDKSRARNGEGTGLGLAIAREIALAHKGDISVSSDQQTGTTFTTLLGPLRDSPA